MKILVTAFDPFGGAPTNPALEIMRALPTAIGGAKIIKRQVPTVFTKAIEAATSAIDEFAPSAVISLGLAGGRSGISVERVAININDARIPDNEGNSPIDQPIDPAGPPAYFATLPVKAMVNAMREVGVEASVSNSAGTFVCNNIMYGVLNHLARAGRPIPAGFVHVPFTPDLARSHDLRSHDLHFLTSRDIGGIPGTPHTPFLNIDDGVRAITAAIEVLVRTLAEGPAAR